MGSKRYKKLPEKTKILPSVEVEKLLPLVKKIVQPNLMNLLI